MSHTKADHALIVIKAALNTVPVVGGAIASLIGDYVPLSTQRSLEIATEELRRRLVACESRLDVEALNKDEFADLFKSCYLAIVRTSQEAKIRAASAVLVNLLLRPGDPDKLSYTELDHIIRSLDSLSVGAITVLGAAKRLVIREGTRSDSEGNFSFLFEQLVSELRGVDLSLLKGLIGELNMLHLLHIVAPKGLRASEYHTLQITALGWRLVGRFLDTLT